MKNGLLGVGLKASDYSILLLNTIIPESKNNFATNRITYNQGNSYACTLFSAFCLIANKFNLDFIDDEWILNKWYNDAVPNYGANPGVGWYISSAVDYVRRWFNNQPELVEAHGTLRTGFATFPYSWNKGEYKEKQLKLVEELINKGHDFCGGHFGSSEYNEDFQSDGVLNLKKLSNPTYAHAVCLSGDLEGEFDMNSDLLVANSWKGVQNNVYRLQYIQDLVDNGVLFQTFYCFFSEKDEIVFDGKDYTANTSNDLVKRFNNQYVMLAETTGSIYDIRGDKMICVNKFFSTKEGREKLIEVYEPLGLLTGISDDNFMSMIK